MRYHPVGSIGRRTVSVSSVFEGAKRDASPTLHNVKFQRSSEATEWDGGLPGWGSVSAYRRIGVWGSKTAFRHRYNDQEISTELMMLCKRRHADTPIRFLRASRPLR
jgi:hypothetical protein